MLGQNFRPPTPDPYHNPQRLDIQKTNFPRQDLKYRILPVIRVSNSLQYSTSIRNRDLTRLTHTSIEPKLAVTVNFIKPSSTSNINSNQTPKFS